MRLDAKSTIVFLGLVAALINIVPLMLLNGGGDLPYQYTIIECYGRQLWQGNFYPHWCMNANAGYGSPMPIFYNLLPFYITSFFYPLFWLGLGFNAIYIIGVLLAGWITFIGAVYWLRGLTGDTQKAIICATILLWLPYRMELLTVRSALTELWGLALLPPLFYYMQHLVIGTRRVWPHIALILTLSLLCHPITSLMGLIICGVHLLAFRCEWKKWFSFSGCVLLSFCAVSFHWYPAKALLPFSGELKKGNMRDGWANYYADGSGFEPIHFLWGDFEPISWLRAWHLAVMVIAFFLSIFLYRSPRIIADRHIKQMILASAMTACLSAILFFSISTPLWGLIQLFTKTLAPWRAALLGVFALIMLLAILFKYYYRPKLAIVLVVASMLIGSAMIQVPPVPSSQARELLEMGQYIIPYFNTSKWLDSQYIDKGNNAFYERFVFNRPAKNAALVSRNDVSIKQWNSEALIIEAQNFQPDRLILEQFYFPLWRAKINGTAKELQPLDDGTGRMFMDLPVGHNEIIIWQNIFAALPAYYRFICALSFISIIFMMGAVFKGRLAIER